MYIRLILRQNLTLFFVPSLTLNLCHVNSRSAAHVSKFCSMPSVSCSRLIPVRPVHAIMLSNQHMLGLSHPLTPCKCTSPKRCVTKIYFPSTTDNLLHLRLFSVLGLVRVRVRFNCQLMENRLISTLFSIHADRE